MKKLLLTCLIMLTTACTAKDANYYLANPKVLQETINACPQKQPEHMTCAELKDLAYKFNQLVNELQAGPQEFGSRILSLQETIARQEAVLAQSKENDLTIQEQIKSDQKELAERLIIVKLLESPEG